MRKLIVNGDDFGFNREITDGIIECHTKGILTSTTLMVNMPAVEYAVEEGKKYPNLSVGIHLNLTQGRPLSAIEKIPALVGSDGNFKNQNEMFKLANRLRLPSEQVERELSAQIERFLSFGITPTHSDSHHHIADCLQIFPIKLRLMKKYNIKRLRTHRGFYRFDRTSSQKLKVFAKMLKTNTVRLPYRLYYEFQHIYCRFKGYRLPDVRYGFSKVISSSPLKFDITGWLKFIKNMPAGIAEFCAHPGLPSNDPVDKPAFRARRIAEYNLLINPECKKICREQNVELISFREL
jgi:predicted glycoside hydrolase/deacetylase ChbG (UPF0249 family)